MERKVLSRLLTVSPAIIYVTEVQNDRFKPTWISRNISRVLGYSPLQAMTDRWWIDNIHPDDRDKAMEGIHQLIENGESIIFYRFKNYNGNYRYIQDNAQVRKHDSGLIQVIGSWLDVTENSEKEQKIIRLHRAYSLLSKTNETITHQQTIKKLYQKICNIAVKDGGFKLAWIGEIDKKTRKVIPKAKAGADKGYVDQVNATIDDNIDFGRGPVGSAIREGRVFICRDVENDPTFLPWRQQALDRGYRSVIAYPLRDDGNSFGSIALYADRPYYFDDEELALLAEMADDLSFGVKTIKAAKARKRAEQEISKLAYYDTLTGLPNFESLKEILGNHLKKSKKSELTALIIFSIDQFSNINHALGYEKADKLLIKVCERIQDSLWEECSIYRFTGSIAAISFYNLTAIEQCLLFTKQLFRLFEQPTEVAGIPIDITFSAGISMFPVHGRDVVTLTRHADRARKISKERAGNEVTVFSQELDIKSDNLDLLTEIRRAIDRSELVLNFQPVIDLKRDYTQSVETLVRWEHPERGIVPPGEFISFAEDIGLITDISLYVIEKSLIEQKKWQKNGINLDVSVNVSSHDIANLDFYHGVHEILSKENFDPRRLTLELTESAIMENPELCVKILHDFHNLGIKFSVDDFGTGYSSLAYLARLDLDQIKIDRTFVLNMQENDRDLTIVRSTINLAHDLGLNVVAEGIETESVMKVLKGLGCNKAQGYGISRPLTGDNLISWLKKGDFPLENNSNS